MLGDIPNPGYLRRMREVYYAATTMVDEQVGRILDTLEETGQLENTLIIFTSDHGELLGDYGLYQKWEPYDSCARIPFIVRYPQRFAPGSVWDEFVDLNDILPTALDVAELEYPADFPLPGESLCSNDPHKDRGWQYIEYAEDNRRWISVRNHTHKYNYYYGGGFEQLFDQVADPHETNNLLHGTVSNSVRNTQIAMRDKLLAYERQWGLEGYVGEHDFKVGEPYQPYPQRNEAYQRFIHQIIDPNERKAMNDLVDEIPIVLAQEAVVQLRDLDIPAWQHNLGISDQELEQLLSAHDQLREEHTPHARN